MTNDEIPNDEGMPNDQARMQKRQRAGERDCRLQWAKHWGLGIRHSFVIRH
jgi:hypothetical protein